MGYSSSASDAAAVREHADDTAGRRLILVGLVLAYTPAPADSGEECPQPDVHGNGGLDLLPGDQERRARWRNHRGLMRNITEEEEEKVVLVRRLCRELGSSHFLSIVFPKGNPYQEGWQDGEQRNLRGSNRRHGSLSDGLHGQI